jgi:uncharacterized protein (TIGR01777 family)
MTHDKRDADEGNAEQGPASITSPETADETRAADEELAEDTPEEAPSPGIREKTTDLTMTIAGASGVVGRHVVALACERGWAVRVLTRDASQKGRWADGVERVEWHPTEAVDDTDSGANDAVVEALEGSHLLVNLAGASIASGRLNADHRARMRSSRLGATGTLVRAYERASSPPVCWFQASAVGYYGDAGERTCEESDPPGDLFLSQLCVEWEAAAAQINEGSDPDRYRLVVGRIGLVLAADAPAWQKMLKPIRFGLGGRLGSGTQWYPWIDADDLARAVLHLHQDPGAVGPFNLTAPQPVRQVELAKMTAERLGKKAFLPTPAFVLRLALGKAADELVLPSCKALPGRLLDTGFAFRRETFDEELDKLLE